MRGWHCRQLASMTNTMRTVVWIRKYSSYNRDEVERMIELSCTQQERLGVYEILRQGINRLIHEVLKLI